MRHFPNTIKTKEDFEYLLQMSEHKQRALSELREASLVSDDTIKISTALKDPSTPEEGWNRIEIENPNPLWDRIGFQEKQEMIDLYDSSLS